MVMLSRLLVYTEKPSTNDTLGLFQYYLFNEILNDYYFDQYLNTYFIIYDVRNVSTFKSYY